MLRSIGISLVVCALGIAVSACQFDQGGLPGQGSGGDTDPSTDPPGVQPQPDAPTCWAWTVSYFDPCDPTPSGDVTIADGTWTYDTVSGVLRSPTGVENTPASQLLAQASGPTVRLLTLASLTVEDDGTLRVIGSNPLIIASWSTIDVVGTIDASSRVDGAFAGAGSEPTMCADAAPTPGHNIQDGPGGGGGGAFAGKGGNGGDGKAGTKGSGGTGGPFPNYVRGGCAGAIGGADQLPGGSGNAGGGAIHLVAQNSISVMGMVEAGGAGGGSGLQGDDNNGRGSGGGGAGSGGYIGLEAPSVMLSANAILAANGGGGGEAGDPDDDGAIGEDGLLAMVQALGGAGDADKGGNGGNGGYSDKPDGKGGKRADVGGGGGGGAGFVVLRAETLVTPVATISPTPTIISW